MRVILFGATGMIGQGVLRECLLDPRVTRVLSIGRASSGRKHEKLEDLVHADLFDYSGIAERLAGYDACFFCLGITSAGMSEAAYTRVTYNLSVSAGLALLRASPRLRLCFISGAGADSSETGRVMWARVKGRAENALLAMPFTQVTIFRPGIIEPLHGITSRTASYRLLYALLAPLVPVVHALAPAQITTTESIGRAMLQVALAGSAKRVLTNADINAAAAALPAPG
jgi:uncharacterized protein YbjT (DUF2867 family)